MINKVEYLYYEKKVVPSEAVKTCQNEKGQVAQFDNKVINAFNKHWDKSLCTKQRVMFFMNETINPKQLITVFILNEGVKILKTFNQQKKASVICERLTKEKHPHNPTKEDSTKPTPAENQNSFHDGLYLGMVVFGFALIISIGLCWTITPVRVSIFCQNIQNF